MRHKKKGGESMNAATSGNIRVMSEIKIKYIISLNLTIDAQKHGICKLRGMPENGIDAQEAIASGQDIRVIVLRDESGIVLFNGIVKEARLYVENGVYELQLLLVTASDKLDRKACHRSFQNSGMTYGQAITKVMESYGNPTVIYTEEAEKTLCTPVIQYGETDWQFLKRLGSRIHIPLYADYLGGTAGFYFGIRKGRRISLWEDTVEQTVRHDYRVGISRSYYEAVGKNTGGGTLSREDFLYYEITADEDYHIGDILALETDSYIIFKKHAELLHGRLVFTYCAGRRGNWYIPEISHEQLRGMEFTGTVMNADKENAHIRLQMDGENGGSEYEWEWAPVSGNILYAMPEKETQVRLCFGSTEASEGVAADNVRMNGPSMPESQERTFQTAAGKKISLHPFNLSFNGAGGGMSVQDSSGINLQGAEKIRLLASGTIMLYASRIHVRTPQEINLYRAQSYCTGRSSDIAAKGTKNNLPTGTGGCRARNK